MTGEHQDPQPQQPEPEQGDDLGMIPIKDALGRVLDDIEREYDIRAEHGQTPAQLREAELEQRASADPELYEIETRMRELNQNDRRTPQEEAELTVLRRKYDAAIQRRGDEQTPPTP